VVAKLYQTIPFYPRPSDPKESSKQTGPMIVRVLSRHSLSRAELISDDSRESFSPRPAGGPFLGWAPAILPHTYHKTLCANQISPPIIIRRTHTVSAPLSNPIQDQNPRFRTSVEIQRGVRSCSKKFRVRGRVRAG
jgi:hypothetical protein